MAAGTAGASAPLGDQAARRARPNRKPKMQLWQRPAQQSGTGHDGHVDAPPTPPEQAPAANGRPAARIRRGREVYAAIDLGTNNCRLLVARRTRDGFRVVDAFSRVVRLGEGVRSSGALSEEAMDRAVDALENCVEKMSRRGVTRSWSIATEACRIAENGDVFRDRVRARTGLELDIISTEREASLALQGCKPLIEPWADYALVFDIGGGSTELIWVDCRGETPELADWVSLPSGVVTLTEALEGHDPGAVDYHHMLDVVRGQLADFAKRHGLKENHAEAKIQLLGTSGTVTTLAGIHLKLPRYDRRAVDGSWIPSPALLEISHRLAALDYDGRVAEPCIGEERADLVVAGCAIMEAIMIEWPTLRVRVADRGLREGMLLQLMAEAQRERRKKRRRRGGGGRGRRGGNNKQSQNINAEAAEGTS
ncbi:MAG: Ppx/GppA phosphatase family protein [Alphaproteobacteria bacterium]